MEFQKNIKVRIKLIHFATILWTCLIVNRGIVAEELPQAKQKKGVNISRVMETLEKRDWIEPTCGQECLYLLCRLERTPQPLVSINKLVKSGEQGASMTDIVKAANQLGLKVKAIQCVPRALSKLPLPAIAHLEPSSDKKFNHYVLVTNVTTEAVTVVDPNINRTIEVPRESFSRMSSGYYLVPDRSPYLTPIVQTTCIVTSCLIIFFLLSRYTMKYFRELIHCDGLKQVASLVIAGKRINKGGRLIHIIPLLISIASNGCNKSREDSDSLGIHSAQHVLSVSSTKRNMGIVDIGAPVHATFRFQNTGTKPIQFSISDPTCGCLDVALNPKVALHPGREGTLMLSLNTNVVSGGQIGGKVMLGVKDSTECYEFSVIAFVEGYVGLHPSRMNYVVRTNQYESGRIPPLVFRMFVKDKETPWSIDSVTAHEYLNSSGLLDKRKHKPLHEEPGAPLQEVQPLFDQVSIRQVNDRIQEQGITTEVTIPIKILSLKKPMRGRFAIRYTLRNTEYCVTVPFVILAPNTENELR